MKVSNLKFVDLYLGQTFCDIKGLDGTITPTVPAPTECLDDLNEIRHKCDDIHSRYQKREFSMIHDEKLYRVTKQSSITNENIYILRPAHAMPRAIGTIGFHSKLISLLLAKETKGLILIAGEMGAGKTTSAASIISERLKMHGGIAITIEDPVETMLAGVHGDKNGRCLQAEVSGADGYKSELRAALRSNPDMILIGEIRDEDVAYEVLKSSINGTFIVSTIHAGDIAQAIERMQTLTQRMLSSANHILADGLTAVISQEVEQVPTDANGRTVKRIKIQQFILDESNGSRQRIRSGRVDMIRGDVEEQLKKWNWQK